MTGSAKQSIARLRRFAPRNDGNCLRPKGCDGQVRSAIHGGQVGPIVPRDGTGQSGCRRNLRSVEDERDLAVDNFALHQWRLHPQSPCRRLRASSYRLIISWFQPIN
jgi:hypothetical protein